MSDTLRLFADYYQIHLFDEGSTSDLGQAWTGQAAADRMAVARDAVAVGTVVNVFVEVTVELSEQPPVDQGPDFDHVVEGSVEVRSGRLVVMGCTDYEPDAVRFAVPTGLLRIRVTKSNLDAAARLGVRSDEDPDTTERIRIQVWPSEPPEPTVVLKRWHPHQT